MPGKGIGHVSARANVQYQVKDGGTAAHVKDQGKVPLLIHVVRRWLKYMNKEERKLVIALYM